MKITFPQFAWSCCSRSKRLRDAVVETFSNDAAAAFSKLRQFQERDWQTNYRWIDASGLALYLLQNLAESGRLEILPASVLARFQQNMTDNIVRTHALLDEAARIKRAFESCSIDYLVLKGFTLSPDAVSHPTLRLQLDLDFLVKAEQAEAARRVLGDYGYKLDVVSGDTWEFKACSDQVASIRDLYKTKPQKSIELHLVHEQNDKRFERARFRQFALEIFPTLSPVDLFLGQAFHAFTHIASPFTRMSWLLEFRRHVLTHRDDDPFWSAVRADALDESKAIVVLGVVTMMAEELFGVFAPSQLRSWTVDRLPSAVVLWVRTYGREALQADFPGTKLYLLLQKALGNEADLKAADIRRRLVPVLRPRMISNAALNERFIVKVRRIFFHLQFFLSRIRFHIREGLRYAFELPRWRRRLAEDAL